MGLSRRQFTKGFKLAAVRLGKGVSLGEVARGLQVNPNVLLRMPRETRQQTIRELRERALHATP